ncbi:UNVERIFIED_CONTAM: hypothetical protein HDU68_012836 [Siphonaria sp. JEL0065]|nr:hypothetical protein HDU68_012836 [Siphonaria sp. JEL0065]
MRVSIIALAFIATASAQAPTATTDTVAASASTSASASAASASASSNATATTTPMQDTYDPAYIDQIMNQGKALWAFLPVSIVGTVASLIPFFRNFE